MGIPPTGQQATWSGMTIYRIAGDKIVEVMPSHFLLETLIGA